jgi:glycosyltransferase involved in cell wall biosynthesis
MKDIRNTPILYLASSRGIGVSTLLTQYVIGLKKNGLCITPLISEKSQEPGLREKLENNGLSYIIVSNLESINPLIFLSNILMVLRIIASKKIQIIQCQSLIHLLVIYPAARFAKTSPKIVTYFHGFPSTHESSLRILLPLMGLMADLILPVSDQTKKILIAYGIPEKKLQVMHNALNFDEIRGYQVTPLESSVQDICKKIDGRKFIVYGAKLVDRKDHQTLFYAAKKVLEKEDVVFIIAHDGPLRNHLVHLTEELGIQDNVIFTGRIEHYEDIIQLMAHEYLGLVTSKAETFCLAIIEPMALGKPVITTAVGIAEDVIVDGETGYIIPIQDWRLLAEKILFLLQNQSSVEVMGKKAKNLVENKFSIDRTSRDLIEIYKCIIET